MFNLKWWIIASYTVLILILLISFDLYLRRKKGEGLGGRIKIPKKII